MSVDPVAAANGETGTLAALHGSDASFADVTEPYRRQLHVHCYRMLGSFDDAEDMVQETMLCAWRGRHSFEGRSLLRTWLYRIATTACLNALERAPRRMMPSDVVPPVTIATDSSQARETPPWRPELPWLQPYPDALLEPPVPSDTEPDTAEDRYPTLRPDLADRLAELVAAGCRGDAVELFQTEAVGIPPEVVAQLRHAPFRPGLEAIAHTLVYDATIIGDRSIPTKLLASVATPTLVLCGELSPPFLHDGARAVAEALPNGRHCTLPGQTHDIHPDATAPVLVEFLTRHDQQDTR